MKFAGRNTRDLFLIFNLCVKTTVWQDFLFVYIFDFSFMFLLEVADSFNAEMIYLFLDA